MLFGDLSLVSCLLGSRFSSGVKCGAVKKNKFLSISQCVHHEGAKASRSPEEVFFKGNTTYTCERECIVSSSFSQAHVVCIPKFCGGPCLLHSACRSEFPLVYGQRVAFSWRISVDARIKYICQASFHNHQRDIWSYISICSDLTNR